MGCGLAYTTVYGIAPLVTYPYNNEQPVDPSLPVPDVTRYFLARPGGPRIFPHAEESDPYRVQYWSYQQPSAYAAPVYGQVPPPYAGASSLYSSRRLHYRCPYASRGW